MTLNEEVEEEIAGFTEEVHIRSVKLENDADRMDEEQHESEHEMAVDEEVDTDSADRAMNWALLEESPTRREDGAEADVQSAGAGFDYEDPEEMQEDGEESESCASTEYGSLQLIQEDFEAFEDLTTLPMTSTGGSCFSMREEWSTMWSSSWHGLGSWLLMRQFEGDQRSDEPAEVGAAWWPRGQKESHSLPTWTKTLRVLAHGQVRPRRDNGREPTPRRPQFTMDGDTRQETNNPEILDTKMRTLGHQQTMEKKQRRRNPLHLLW